MMFLSYYIMLFHQVIYYTSQPFLNIRSRSRPARLAFPGDLQRMHRLEACATKYLFPIIIMPLMSDQIQLRIFWNKERPIIP